MLRIIAGKYRSIKLKQPPINITRSTTDRVRESIFNIIQNDIENSIVLDGFSGSGAMALESISRGSSKAICIEKNKKAFDIIVENVTKLKINNVDVFNTDFISYLTNKKNIQFDFIFLDPPYKEINLLTESLKLIKEKNLLKKYGKIIIETSLDTIIKLPYGLMISNERVYGQTKISFVVNIV